MPPRKPAISRLLPLLVMACLAICAIAGLAVGVYDIAYTSINFKIPQSVEFLALR